MMKVEVSVGCCGCCFREHTLEFEVTKLEDGRTVLRLTSDSEHAVLKPVGDCVPVDQDGVAGTPAAE
jgi:hypothetical protein